MESQDRSSSSGETTAPSAPVRDLRTPGPGFPAFGAGPVVDVAGIDEDAIADGPGLRFVLFVQGCSHNCPGCHNPQTHEFGIGTKMTIGDLFDRITANPLLSGITFSGGDPMFQAGPLADLAARLHRHGHYDIAVFTGFTFEALLKFGTPDQKRLLAAADILIDGPFVQARRDRNLRFRGSSNQRILDLPASLAENRAIWISDPDWLDGDPVHPVEEMPYAAIV